MDQATIDAAFWRTIRRQAVAEGMIGLTAVVLAWFLVRRITLPLSRLARHARKVASLESLFAPTGPGPAEADAEDVARPPDALCHFRCPQMREALPRVVAEFQPDAVQFEELVR